MGSGYFNLRISLQFYIRPPDWRYDSFLGHTFPRGVKSDLGHRRVLTFGSRLNPQLEWKSGTRTLSNRRTLAQTTIGISKAYHHGPANISC